MADDQMLDSTRTLLLTGLKELNQRKNEVLKEAVQNMIAELFSLPIDTVEKVVKTRNDDGSAAALVLFNTGLNRNRVYTQREKFPESVKAALQLSKIPKKKIEEKKDEPTGHEEQSGDDVVLIEEVEEKKLAEKQIVEDEEEKLAEKQIVGDEESTKNELETEETKKQAADITEVTDDHNEMTQKDEEEKDEPDDIEDDEHIEVDEENAEADQNMKGNESELPIDWVGCPEFQWIPISNMDDREKLILDDVSLTDLKDPFLYRTLLRARQVSLNFRADIHNQSFENVLRKGRLVLTFTSDGQAIGQAANSLVFMRTPRHRKIKVSIPQTNVTLRQRKLLEDRMGRIQKLGYSSRQLLVRNVSKECDEEMIKLGFVAAPDEIIAIAFRDDGLGRRCAVVTFTTAEFAIAAHLKHSELKVGQGGNWRPVLYMRDILPRALMLKTEAKLNRQKQGKPPRVNRMKRVSHNSKSAPAKAAKDTEQESDSAEKSEITPNSEDGAKSTVERPNSVSEDTEKQKESSAKRSYPDSKSSVSQPSEKKRLRSFNRDRWGPPVGGMPPRGQAQSSSFRGGRGFARGRDYGRPDFYRGPMPGRTNPWMDVDSVVDPSVDSLQAIMAEQERKFEIQRQLIRRQEILDNMQLEINRRNAPGPNYGNAYGSSASGFPGNAPAPGNDFPPNRGRYDGPPRRPYSPPQYRSPPRWNEEFRY